jgi:hypothetical protein
MTQVNSDAFFRQNQSLFVYSDGLFTNTNSKVIADAFLRQNQALFVGRDSFFRNKTMDELFNSKIEQQTDADWTSYKAGIEILIKDLNAGVTKKISGNLCDTIDFSVTRNQPISWSISINDNKDRAFNPANTSGAYYGYLTPDVYNSAWNINKVWYIHVYIEGEHWYSPALILVDSTVTATTSGYKTTFSGIDMSKNLLQENLTLTSKESTGSTVWTNKTIITYILGEYGYTSIDLSGLDEFPVRIMQFQGSSPMDLITRLLNVTMGDWYFRDRTFVATQRKFNQTGADWTFKDRFNITELTYKNSSSSVVNEITVSRTQTTAKEEYFEGTSNARQYINLQYPRYRPIFKVAESRFIESFNDIDFKNASGNWRSQGASPPYVSFAFTPMPFLVNPNNATAVAGDTLYWKIRISGMTEEQINMAGLGFDDSFNITVRDLNNQAKYGKCPAPNPIDDPLIPNSGWALIHGKRYLGEQIRKSESIEFALSMLNPFINPADTMKITEYGTMLTEENFFVESVKHDFKSMRTNVSATKYENYDLYFGTEVN